MDVFFAASPVRAAWIRTLEGAYDGPIQEPPAEDGLFSLRSPGWPSASTIAGRLRRHDARVVGAACGVVGIWAAPASGGGAPWRDYTGSCPAFDDRRPEAGRDRVVVRLICPRGCRGSVSVALRDAPGKRLTRKRVALRASPRARLVRLPLDAGDARALRRAGRSAPPVVIQRFSGRDGTGAPVVVRHQRYVRGA